MGILLIIMALLPTIVLGSFIYKNDKIEKEPTSLLIGLLLSGILAVIMVLIVTEVLYTIFPSLEIMSTSTNPLEMAIYVFFGIALVEEFSKWFFTYIFAWRNKAFNHVYDAIVYSVFVSLGFATIENILYILMASSDSLELALLTAFNRMIFSVPGHAFFGVMMGYYLGLSKLTYVNNITGKSRKYLLYSLVVPMLCHFIFDYLLFLEYDFALLLFFIYVIFLYIFAIKKVKKLASVTTNIFNHNHIENNNYVCSTFNKFNYCKKCGNMLKGPYCSNCGEKNY